MIYVEQEEKENEEREILCSGIRLNRDSEVRKYVVGMGIISIQAWNQGDLQVGEQAKGRSRWDLNAARTG